MLKTLLVMMCILSLSGFVFAEDIVVKVNLVDENGIGKDIGTVAASDSQGSMRSRQVKSKRLRYSFATEKNKC
ncbi:MAG: hypothetical protein AB1442_05465 [Nitrospirota bacterium]